MSNFDDFDNDTPPQGGYGDDPDAELVMQAERQAEEDQMVAELAREEEDDRQAEQRRLDDARRDQAQRDDDDRRDGIQSDIDRRDDWNRAEQERVARQAEADAEMEFSMGPQKEKPTAAETSDREAFMKGVRERHIEEMKTHAAEVAAKEAAEKDAHPAFYKGGFADVKGGTVSAQDLTAIMANYQAAGGHKAAQERFGLATGKGSELAAAHYAPGASLDAAPTAAEQLGALRGGQQLTNAELLQKVEADQVATDERQAEAAARLAGTASERQEAVQASSGAGQDMNALLDRDAFSERELALLAHVDQLQAGQAAGVEEPTQRDVDWTVELGMSDTQSKAIADKVRTEQVKAAKAAVEAKDPFLAQSGASPAEASVEPMTEREELVLHQVDRLEAEQANGQQVRDGGEDWSERLRESQEQQELARQREAQQQGPELSR